MVSIFKQTANGQAPLFTKKFWEGIDQKQNYDSSKAVAEHNVNETTKTFSWLKKMIVVELQEEVEMPTTSTRLMRKIIYMIYN